MPHAGICAGGRSKERSLPRSNWAVLTDRGRLLLVVIDQRASPDEKNRHDD